MVDERKSPTLKEALDYLTDQGSGNEEPFHHNKLTGDVDASPDEEEAALEDCAEGMV